MKVGLFLGNYSLQAGGGYTFVESILDACLKEKFGHKLYIFSEQEIENRNPAVKCIFLQNNIFERIYLQVLRIVEKIYNFLSGKELEIYMSKLNIEAKKNNIELMWFISPNYERISIPYIYTVWDLAHRNFPFFPEFNSSSSNRLQRERHFEEVLPGAVFIITGTKVGKEEINRYYQIPEERIRIIPLPTPSFLNEMKFREDKIVRSKLKLPEKYLFYPAQYWPHKNHIVLLHAMKTLLEKYKLPLSLVICGSDKGNKRYLENKVFELDLTDNVIFLDLIGREELIHVYKNAFALTFPTFFGPDNLPPLEAFQLGIPVIASKIPGAEEQLGEAAILVDPTDVGAWAKVVNDLYKNPDTKKNLIKHGLVRGKKWTADNYVKSVAKIIKKFEPYRRCWSSTNEYELL